MILRDALYTNRVLRYAVTAYRKEIRHERVNVEQVVKKLGRMRGFELNLLTIRLRSVALSAMVSTFKQKWISNGAKKAQELEDEWPKLWINVLLCTIITKMYEPTCRNSRWNQRRFWRISSQISRSDLQRGEASRIWVCSETNVFFSLLETIYFLWCVPKNCLRTK